jgi:hypothetical protein
MHALCDLARQAIGWTALSDVMRVTARARWPLEPNFRTAAAYARVCR